MYRGKVIIAGVDTACLPVMKEEEKERLLLQVKSGTASEQRKAREALVKGNLRLVLSVVQRFSGRGENLDDLFQVGCIGLIKAIDHFDLDQSVRFSTYAVPMIIGEVRRFLRDYAPVRVSRSLKDLAYRAMQEGWLEPWDGIPQSLSCLLHLECRKVRSFWHWNRQRLLYPSTNRFIPVTAENRCASWISFPAETAMPTGLMKSPFGTRLKVCPDEKRRFWDCDFLKDGHRPRFPA